MSGLASVSDSNFEQDVLKSDKPVLVYFWAPWCGPCRTLSPILESIVQEMGNNEISVKKMNLEDNREVAAGLNIRSIPTLIVFKNGQPVATQIGGLTKAALADFINSNI